MQKGWIHIHRKIQDCCIWCDEDPFDKRSAWIDLLLSANHRDNQIIFNGKPLVIHEGQYLTSVRKLAERWHWSNDRTLRYLRLLESLGMIVREADNSRTLLTIVNYGLYNNMPNTNKYTDKSQTRMEECKNNISTKVDISKSSSIDYQGVVDKYNSICVSFKKVNKLSEDRKKVIKARLNTYTVDDLVAAFQKAESSDFLKGKNDKNWMADFDWMLKDRNLAKILDGNYDNKPGFKKATKNSFNDFSLRQNYEGLDLEHWGE